MIDRSSFDEYSIVIAQIASLSSRLNTILKQLEWGSADVIDPSNPLVIELTAATEAIKTTIVELTKIEQACTHSNELYRDRAIEIIDALNSKSGLPLFSDYLRYVEKNNLTFSIPSIRYIYDAKRKYVDNIEDAFDSWGDRLDIANNANINDLFSEDI